YRYISSGNEPFIYVPTSQQPQTSMEIYIRHAAGRQLAADVRTAIAQVDSSVPVIMLQSFDDAAAAATQSPRGSPEAWARSASSSRPSASTG
ncbi:MAG: hypothetical protein RLZZ53_2707, partial [Acidobacteriota bacterium]